MTATERKEKNKKNKLNCSVADPAPGSGASFTPLSGIRIWDPEWENNPDPGSGYEHPGPYFLRL
jgi:hypothetical protein